MFHVGFAEPPVPGDPACFTDEPQGFWGCPCFPEMPSAWAPGHDLPLWTTFVPTHATFYISSSCATFLAAGVGRDGVRHD